MIADGDLALRVEDASVSAGDRTILDGVTLRLAGGEIVALAGPNGSGKSTLIRAALGLLPLRSGRTRLFGTDVAGLSVRERALRAAWVPQEEPLRDDVRIGEYVLYGRFAHLGAFDAEGPSDRAAAESALRSVELWDRRDGGVLELSGGERQRLTLARALAQGAPLLLLDEPTAHLDIGHTLDLLGRVRELAHRNGLAVLVAIHDLNLAARYADRIVVLSRGRVAAEGPPARVLSATILRTVWGIAADLRTDPRSGLPYLLPRLAVDEPTPGAPAEGWGPVHVLGGGGAGARWMRAVADAGYRVTAGALHLLDSDAEVAESLGIPVALEAPFAPLSDEVRARNRSMLRSAQVIVVPPFAVGPSNLGNLRDVVDAPAGIPRILVGPSFLPSMDFAGGEAVRLRRAIASAGARVVEAEPELLAMLAGIRRRPAPTDPEPREPDRPR